MNRVQSVYAVHNNDIFLLLPWMGLEVQCTVKFTQNLKPSCTCMFSVVYIFTVLYSDAGEGSRDAFLLYRFLAETFFVYFFYLRWKFYSNAHYTMILQRIRIIVVDAEFEPGTSAPEVWRYQWATTSLHKQVLYC